jgi:hypothetical protein
MPAAQPVGAVPRSAPNGKVRFLEIASVVALMVTCAVPWWSPTIQSRLAAVRTAIVMSLRL